MRSWDFNKSSKLMKFSINSLVLNWWMFQITVIYVNKFPSNIIASFPPLQKLPTFNEIPNHIPYSKYLIRSLKLSLGGKGVTTIKKGVSTS